MSDNTMNLGPVTAYASAVEGGYTGTYAEFCQTTADFANIANDIDEALEDKADLIDGKIPSHELPSYVDDVVEAYYDSTTDRFYEESTFETVITPVEGKAWVDISTNKTYRWTGSVYVRVDEGVQLGETSDTAYAGNKGKANAEAIVAIKDGQTIDSFGDVETALADKVDKVTGKGLSTNDYDNTAKGIVDGVTAALADKADKSSLGTASEKDVPISGNASPTQVVMGDDTRLSDARNAADVSAWAKASTKPSYTATEVGAIASTEKGMANGVAELDANGKVPSAQLPSYVDDVLEYTATSDFPVTGEAGKIYVATSTNKTYRWGGSEYIEISESLALGETSSTAYAGNKGKANADAISGILDGTSIDSFGDVETALEGKADTSDIPDITGKADKVSGATNGNFAGLDANGNLTDSGSKATDFANSAQAVPTGGTTGQVLKKVSNSDNDVEWADESGGEDPVVTRQYALKFSSDSNFTLSASKRWNGTIEYSIDNGNTWNTWDGSQLSGTASQPIYLRGTENSVITNGYFKWTFTGKYCTGNIENLLNYQIVANGQHPVMANKCYQGMFQSCTSLAKAPELPATTLAESCYLMMFYGCTSLAKAPELPATTLAESCYASMFAGCTSLKLSATQTGEYQYAYRIPIMGTGTTASNAMESMFGSTGGTFTGTPTINTTYYTDHPVGDDEDKNVVLPINPTAAMISGYATGTMWIETE